MAQFTLDRDLMARLLHLSKDEFQLLMQGKFDWTCVSPSLADHVNNVTSGSLGAEDMHHLIAQTKHEKEQVCKLRYVRYRWLGLRAPLSLAWLGLACVRGLRCRFRCDA